MKAPPMPGEDQLGAVVYNIEAGLIEANIIRVPGLSRYWIDDVAEEVYPRGRTNSQRDGERLETPPIVERCRVANGRRADAIDDNSPVGPRGMSHRARP